mgnify:CR=1 FL=1
MELIDVFKQLVKDYPETFTLSERTKQLDLTNCPWNIARIGERPCNPGCFICRVHDFTQNKVNDFEHYIWQIGVTINYSKLVEIYLTEPQKVYDTIVKSMTAYYELKNQAELKLYNKQVDQTLKNLD